MPPSVQQQIAGHRQRRGPARQAQWLERQLAVLKLSRIQPNGAVMPPGRVIATCQYDIALDGRALVHQEHLLAHGECAAVWLVDVLVVALGAPGRTTVRNRPSRCTVAMPPT